jgi:hypothetical protein
LRIFAFIFTCLHKQNVSVLLVFISSSSSSFCSSSFLRVIDTFLVVLGGGAKNRDEVFSSGRGKEEEKNPSRDAVFEKSAKARDARRIVIIISSCVLCVYFFYRDVFLSSVGHAQKDAK